MSIVLKNRIAQLEDRVSRLESAINLLSKEPPKCAGEPMPEVNAKTPAEKKAEKKAK